MTRRTENLMLQTVVFFLTAAAFSTIYVTHPVLPVLARGFYADAFHVSLTVCAVIFGISIAIIPVGSLADRSPGISATASAVA